MIGNGQGQKVGEKSTAIQAGRDVVVGPSISEVMAVVAQSIQIHTEAARQLVNDRLGEFEAKLTEKFSKGNAGAVSSFADPDMQGALLDAQKSYTRSGSDDLHVVLTDLVYQRANESGNSRIAIVLNDAIAKSARLTKVDFANLAFIFYIMNVGVIGKSSPDFIAQRLRAHLAPLAAHVDFSDAALEYLDSQGLLLSGPHNSLLKPNPLTQVLKHKYAEAFNAGFSLAELEEMHPGVAILNLTKSIQTSPFDAEKVYVPVTAAALDKMAVNLIALVGFGDKYQAACRQRLIDDALFVQEMSKFFPEFEVICQSYNRSRVGVTRLSPTAIAIGHAYMTKEAPFSGSLDIWIKP